MTKKQSVHILKYQNMNCFTKLIFFSHIMFLFHRQINISVCDMAMSLLEHRDLLLDHAPVHTLSTYC